jgi:hypothetical protein
MYAPTTLAGSSNTFCAADLESLSIRHDARLQEDLRVFCMAHAGEQGSAISTWLSAAESRPLWQLAIIAITVNKGLVMMTDNKEYDAEILNFDPHAPIPAPTEVCAPDEAQSPYVYEQDTSALECADDCKSFERELEKLTLTVRAGAREPGVG